MIASPTVSALRTMPGPGRGRDAERPAERGTDRGPGGRDLVLRLERADAEVLVARELLEDRARRRDRVGAEEERQPESRDAATSPERQRLVAGDVPYVPGASFAGFTSYVTAKDSVVSPNA
jgi:hypothetical protein